MCRLEMAGVMALIPEAGLRQHPLSAPRTTWNGAMTAKIIGIGHKQFRQIEGVRMIARSMRRAFKFVRNHFLLLYRRQAVCF